MSSNPPPREGVIVLYENVRFAVTEGKIHVIVNADTVHQKEVLIDQRTGEVVHA